MAVFCQYGSTSLDSYQSAPMKINKNGDGSEQDDSHHHRTGLANRYHGMSPSRDEVSSFLFGISPTLYPYHNAATSYRVTDSDANYRNQRAAPSKHHKPRPCLKQIKSSQQPQRRRVTFADSKGLVLTSVKYLFESSNEPPKSFIDGNSLYEAMKNLNLTACDRHSHTYGWGESAVSGRLSAPSSSSSASNKFSLEFQQPFANYAQFAEKLERDSVSLENCSVECNGLLSGTVKVRNHAFDKQVMIRISTDQWRTHVDRACTHNAQASSGPRHDTFSFNINDLVRSLPANCTSAHFCVRYVCAGVEYWDNNHGRNYSININLSPLQQRQPLSSYAQLKPAFHTLQSPTTYEELPNAQHSVWADADLTSPFY